MNKIRLTLLMLMAFMMSLASFGQNRATGYAEIGTGTSSSNYAPISTYWGYSYTQTLYLASDLAPVFGTDGTELTSISYAYTHSTTQEYPIQVWVGNTSRTSMTTTDGFIPAENMTKVYDGPITFTAGWVDIPFTTPFAWDGTSNIVVAVNATLGSDIGYASSFQYTSASNTVLYVRNDSDGAYDPETTTPTTSVSSTGNRPNIRIYGNIACEQISGLTHSTPTAHEVTISWNALTEALSVDLAYGLATSEELTTITGLTETSKTLDGLTANSDYIVKVRANCGDEAHGGWAETSFTTPPTCIAPTAAAVTEGSITTTSAEISWTDNNGTAPANGWTILVNEEAVAAATNPFPLTGLTPSTSYTVKVKANCTDEDASDWSNTVTFATECDIFNVTEATPYMESFDGTTFPPLCWTREHTMGTATKTWVRSTSTVHTGAGSAQLEDQNSGNKNNLVTGQLNIPEANAYQVSFWVYRSSNFATKLNEGVKVWVSATPDTVDATEIMYIHRVYTLEPAEEATGWYKYTAPIATSGDLYVIFEGISEYGTATFIDDIAVEQVPSCFEPSALHLDTVTATTATISWTDNNETAPEGWTISYTAAGTESTVTTAVNPATIENLTPETTYVVKVKANCDASTSSAWSQTINVTTTPSCLAPTNLELSDLQSTSATLSWTARNGETQWILTLNGEEHLVSENPLTIDTLTAETNYTANIRSICAVDDTSSNSSTLAFYTGICIPAPTSVDNSGISNVTFGQTEVVNNTTHPTARPYYGNYTEQVGDGAAGTAVTVDVTYATGYTYGTIIWVNWNNDLEFTDDEVVFAGTSASSNPTTLSCTFTIPASTPVGNYRMRIGGADSRFDAAITAGEGYDPCLSTSYTIYEDYTLSVTEAPACMAPTLDPATNVTSSTATLSWTANNGETEWTIEVNGEETTGITENPYTLEGLTPATNYTVRVKANCSADDASNYGTPIHFTTTCVEITDLPWRENFEDFTVGPVPTCWDNSASTSSTLASNPERIWGVYSYNDNQMLRLYNFFVQTGVALVNSPSVTLPAEGSYELIFKYSHLANCGAFTVNISNDGGNTFVEKGSYTASSSSYSYTNPGTFTEIEPISLAEYAGQSIIVQFNANANYGSGAIFIDDISIATPPTCLKPTDVTISDITTTSATIAWTDNNETAPQSWVIDLNGTEYDATTNPFTIETLTDATSYTVKVKAICTDDDESDWSDTEVFSTECGTVVVTPENPYNEGFESADDFGCWTTEVLSGTTDWIHTSQEAAVGTYSVAFAYSGDSSNLISPVFDLTQVSNVQLSFQHMHPEWTGDPASELYVYYRASATEEWTQIASYTTYYEEFTLETLTLPNTSATYQICFKGVGANGYNVFLDDVTISGEEPVVEPCATPTNVVVENGVVTWTGDAANYNVHIVAGETTIDTTVNTTSYTIEGLNEGDHATVTVQAVCDEENLSEWSEAVEFDYTVGINNYAISANIFPNPTTGNVTVESNAINADITVFDMFGKLMMTSKVAASRTELDFSGFAPGVYMVRIANSNAITTVKVVKE